LLKRVIQKLRIVNNNIKLNSAGVKSMFEDLRYFARMNTLFQKFADLKSITDDNDIALETLDLNVRSFYLLAIASNP